MIPFSDSIASRTTPVVTVSLILINVLVFLYEVSLPDAALSSLIQTHGMIPARMQSLQGVTLNGASLIGSMFLHGGWLHLMGNMLYLWVFGDNVEDSMGHLRFLVFYLLCGLLAGLAHLFLNLQSTIPSIGASGAVAGVLGAYLLLYPYARISTLIPLIIVWPVVELPALLVLGGWFLIQLMQGTAALSPTAQAAGGVAWWAHVGGFAAGLLLVNAFRRHRISLRHRKHS